MPLSVGHLCVWLIKESFFSIICLLLESPGLPMVANDKLALLNINLPPEPPGSRKYMMNGFLVLCPQETPGQTLHEALCVF